MNLIHFIGQALSSPNKVSWNRLPKKWHLICPLLPVFFQLQCLPLASLLLALDNPTVNYLSLDLEGAELQVLCC